MVNEAMNLTGGTCETPANVSGVLLGYENVDEDLHFEAQLVEDYTCCKKNTTSTAFCNAVNIHSNDVIVFVYSTH